MSWQRGSPTGIPKRLSGRQLAVVVLTAAAAAACGSVSRPTMASPAAVEFSTFQSTRFSFRYTAMDAPTIAQTAAAAEAEYARITRDLGVVQMPTVVVTLYPDVETLRQAASPIVGPLPAFAAGLVTGADAIHILSPNLSSRWNYGEAIVNVVHEFAHCVSLRVNPAFGNNPRWLWESVALFEAGQYVDPNTLPYFRQGPLPTFAQLNGFDNTIIYSVGATFGQFVVETRGRDAWLALIRSNGDIVGVLGMDERSFLDAWSAFVRAFFHIS